ncbi:MAG TPA: hypothetical protein VHX38_09365 [Pseudonocardiaceae bacterium]|jgi:hypothetical protein|nr:hypothetical protein [Pseudonocardiaceae bacterium]
MREPSEELRAWLRAVADELIPAGDGMPAAGEIADRQLESVLTARPDLLRHLTRAHLRTAGLDGAAAFAALRELDPEAEAAIAQIVAGGYYADPKVRELLGYTGQRPIPVRPADFPEYVAEGLLDRVLARGPIYRPAD